MRKNISTPADEKEKRRRGARAQIPFSPLRFFPLSLTLLTALVLHSPTARAEIPEPDNVLYGTIAIDNAAITASRTDVVVEARRQTNGPAIASYRMGSNPQLGNFYSLRLKLESLAPALDANASLTGSEVVMVVTDATGVRAQAGYTLAGRGEFQRLDFGTAVPDSDGDGLPDAWETHYFGSLNQNASSIGASGLSALQHFIAGTNPNDPNSVFKLVITNAGQARAISFTALRAEGPGYDGFTRLYTLESTPTLAAASWTGVPGFTNLTGNNQIVTYQTAGLGSPGFFRGRITLQPLGATATDTDADGLPDAWETLHFGDLNQSAGSINANGRSALENYIAGNDPHLPGNQLRLSISPGGGPRTISFDTVSAGGVAYEGKTRFYTLETSPSLAPSSWSGVPGFIRIAANQQTISHQLAGLATPGFFRVAVWLEDQ
jgi:hypothetical protein